MPSLEALSAEFQDAEIGGDKFFALVQTMPDLDEAIDLCKLAKAHFYKIMQESKSGQNHQDAVLGAARINQEMTRINKAREDSAMRNAIFAVYGQEGWDKIRDYMIAVRNGNIET